MKLEQIANLRTGITLRQGVKPKEDGDAYLIQMRDITEDFKTFENSIKIDGSGFKSKHLLHQKDILFIAKGQQNKAILYNKDYERAYALSMFIVIQPNQEVVLPEYLVWYLNESMAQRQIEKHREGTMTTSIGIKALKEIEIEVPPIEEQEKLSRLITLMHQEVSIMEQIKQKRQTIINSLIISKIEKKMIRISLTDFMDFVTKSGVSKQTKVSQLTQRGGYEPFKDFYKKLREGIIGMHREAKKPSTLNNIVPTLTDTKKMGIFPNLISSYIRFLGRKNADWIDPPSSKWAYNELRVKINPELGLRYSAKKNAPVKDYIIKLHLNKTKLEKSKADLILSLMVNELHHESSNEVEYCILDVPRKKLFLSSNVKNDYMPLLKGEAQSIITIWNNLTQSI